nr:MAG TPA: hypothetical protein [Bacteriophage sp.]
MMTLQTFDRLTNRVTRGEATCRCKNIERNTARSRPSTPRGHGKRENWRASAAIQRIASL